MRLYERPLRWSAPGRVLYEGRLARDGRDLSLHMGYDGWKSPTDVPMTRTGERAWEASVPPRGRLLIDCVIRSGPPSGSARGSSSGPPSASVRGPVAGCDNNDGADYRLWIGLDPVDAHVHVRAPGRDLLGFGSLLAAAYSGGMTHAVVSWGDNDFVDIAAEAVPWLTRLVWVRPGGPDPDDVRQRLEDGAAGLKLHPAYDNYPADTAGLDPYLRVAEEAAVPVTVHSAPGPADPDLIARLADRFPTVPFVLYHTYLGPPEGRRRAVAHAKRRPNLHLETSWCDSKTVERLIDDVGPGRVLFGSDAATDGPRHFVREPPNLESHETYNKSLLRLAQRLKPAVFRQFAETNARALFGLPA